MKSCLRLLAVAGLSGLLLAMPSAAGADDDDDDDHDLARELYEHGEIRALSEILRTVTERLPGDIAAVDLIKVDDRWVYRFQVIESDGRRVIVDVDAGAGVIRNESDD